MAKYQYFQEYCLQHYSSLIHNDSWILHKSKCLVKSIFLPLKFQMHLETSMNGKFFVMRYPPNYMRANVFILAGPESIIESPLTHLLQVMTVNGIIPTERIVAKSMRRNCMLGNDVFKERCISFSTFMRIGSVPSAMGKI